MKNIYKLFILASVFFVNSLYSQMVNWGWGQNITITGSGTLTCSVYDPILANTATYTISSSNYDSYVYNEGVLVWTKLGISVNYLIYDHNVHSFKTGYSSISNSVEVILSDGVVAWVQDNYYVDYAIYDPILQSWKTGYSSVSNNVTLTNNNGVVAWVDDNYYVDYATYDPSLQTWKTGYSSVSNSVTLTNNNGVVAWVDDNYYVDYAVYDHNLKVWKTGYSSISNNTTLINQNGVVAWAQDNYYVDYAVYDPDLQTWKTGYQSVSGPVTDFYIQDGTVYYTNSGNDYKKGYSFSSDSWQNNYNTNLHCDIKIYTPSTNPNGIIHLSYMTVGANSHIYNTGDGGTIPDRRLPFKQYTSGGNYDVNLQIYNTTSNSTCTESVSIGAVGIGEENLNLIQVYPIPATDDLYFDLDNSEFVRCKIINLSGQVVCENEFIAKKTLNKVDIEQLNPGVYFLEIYTASDLYRKKIIIQ